MWRCKKRQIVTQMAKRIAQSGERVLALAERLKKQDAPKHLYKSPTKNVSLFNRKQKFMV